MAGLRDRRPQLAFPAVLLRVGTGRRDALPLREGGLEPAEVAAQEVRGMKPDHFGELPDLRELVQWSAPGLRLRSLRRRHEVPEVDVILPPQEIARRRLSPVLAVDLDCQVAFAESHAELVVLAGSVQ